MFKIGDEVRVICADEETCTPTTRSMIGEIAKIVDHSGITSVPYTLHFEADNLKLNFMEKELERCRKIGEQLLFSFMK